MRRSQELDAPSKGIWVIAAAVNKLVGQKAPFKLKEIWAIRVRLQLAGRQRELALFNLAIDSKQPGQPQPR